MKRGFRGARAAPGPAGAAQKETRVFPLSAVLRPGMGAHFFMVDFSKSTYSVCRLEHFNIEIIY